MCIQLFLHPGEAKQVSTAGGALPKWTSDGRAVLFLVEPNTIMRTTVDAIGRIGEPQVLFTTESEIENFEPLPDGRILMILVDAEAAAGPSKVIVRWPDSIRR